MVVAECHISPNDSQAGRRHASSGGAQTDLARGAGGPATGPVSQDPLVTVILCAYNPGEHLRPAVISILQQTYRNLQIILVDDGSTDGSVDGLSDLSDPRLTVLRQENAGKAAALNRALGLARGEFYTQLDADDLCRPERIERQVRTMAAHPEVAGVFCGFDLIIGGRPTCPLFQARSIEECRLLVERFAMPGHDPTAMYRMSMVGDLRYDESPQVGSVATAYDYVLTVGERHPMLVLGECLYSYRVHPGTVTRRDPSERLESVKEVHRRAAARRGLAEHELPRCEGATSGGKWKQREHDNNLAARFVESVLCLRRAGRRREAVAIGLKGAAQQPLDPYYYKALIYALMPLNLVRKWRRSPV